MKRSALFFIGLLSVFCVACEKENKKENTTTPVIENSSTFEDSVKPDDEEEQKGDARFPNCRETYNEPEDNLDGLSRDDLGDFRIALGKAKDDVETHSECFLNEDAKEYYKINYSSVLRDTNDFTYARMNEFTEENYIFEDTYRLSKTKIEINNQSAINRIVDIVSGGLKNDGYFLTFKRATIELNEKNELYRLRVYVNTTQVGKLIDSHKKEENKNWYLLFGQAYFLPYESTNVS